ELCTGSATNWRRPGEPLRGMSALLLLRAVTAAGLLAVADTLSVERPTDDLVTNARQVLHTTATHEHDGVLLKVVPNARNVCGDLDAAGEADTRHLAQGRVGLLGSRSVDAHAVAPELRASLQRRCLRLRYLVLSALTDQLLDSRHYVSISRLGRCYVVVGSRSLGHARPSFFARLCFFA